MTGSKGVAVNGATHDVYVTMTGATPRVAVFHQDPPITVPDATTANPGHPNATSAILKGVINPDGVATTECKFEWGTTTQYSGGSVPCVEGDVFAGSSDANVSYELKSLTLGSEYHYRVVAKNANEQWSYGADRRFEGSTPPTSTPIVVDRVNTDGARFNLEINPHGGTTAYHFEVGLEDCSSNPCAHVPVSAEELESNVGAQSVTQTAVGLVPDTSYYVRLVAENGAGVGTSSYVFRTYPSPPKIDTCGNAHVRQQTSASLLPDCRAYELVSAANAGGYDVESDLVPGQSPFAAYPDAGGRVLYGLHFGSVPGIGGSPPNHGLDPYVAERSAGGWTTRYVGIPADGMADETPFGSPLLGADQGLDAFAFGGTSICEPCFAGLGTNLPVRRGGGAAIPGMAGSLNPGAAAPSGEVRKYLSADGTHLVFGSTKKYETAGVEGALTIYERDLSAGTTRVVSTDSSGATLSGPGTAALDVSADGSGVVIGKQVSTDAAENAHYHLYLHLGASANSVDLTPGGASSALFDGMTADGSKVFFTTSDKLLGQDTDTSADIYRADVSSGGAVTLHLVSVKSNGTASNSDACTPPGSPESWNSVSGNGKCNAVAFAGGAGVAEDDGTFYFVSPEQLDGAKGVADQANLYVVKPGEDPAFVETIDSALGKPGQGPPIHPLVTSNFTGESHSGPEALAVDQSNGDLYVSETGSGKVSRYTSAGAAKNFSSAEPQVEGNKLTGLTLGANSASGIAIDNAGSSPFNGDIYVTDPASLKVFAPTGEALGEITGAENVVSSFGNVCGVAVDQSNGTVYIGDRGYEVLWEYTPKPGAVAPITDSDYTVKAMLITGEFAPCNVAADSLGHVYASRFANGPVRVFETASFESPYAIGSGTQFNEASRALAMDPATNEVYVDEGNQIKIFDSSQELVSTMATGDISGSRGVAVNKTSHHVYASSGIGVAEFGYAVAPYHPIDNPGVIHGVKQAGTHSTADFQVTPDGRYAAFGSSLSLTGFVNLGHAEIYRYDSVADAVECASCATTGAAAKADTFLAPHGLNISEDGRVFFTTDEGLVLSDTNERKDAYEWTGGTNVGRISTGRSLDDSSLLTVSQDGVDALFFTRDVLVPSDENGGAVKIYDARQGGGYLQTNSPLPCAASDECHGPGTVAPSPPNINSQTGAGPEGPIAAPKRCKRGFVKRHGRCVKKHRKGKRRHNHRKRHNHRTQGNG